MKKKKSYLEKSPKLRNISINIYLGNRTHRLRNLRLSLSLSFPTSTNTFGSHKNGPDIFPIPLPKLFFLPLLQPGKVRYRRRDFSSFSSSSSFLRSHLISAPPSSPSPHPPFSRFSATLNAQKSLGPTDLEEGDDDDDDQRLSSKRGEERENFRGERERERERRRVSLHAKQHRGIEEEEDPRRRWGKRRKEAA